MIGSVTIIGALALASMALGAPLEALSPWGTRLAFHGWAPDGTHLAYTRTRRRLGPKGDRVKVTRMNRGVSRCRLSGSGGKPGRKTDFESWLQKRGYRDEMRVGRSVDERLFRFDSPEGAYMLDIKVGEAMKWELSFEGIVIERRTFDAPYIDFAASFHPGPNRECGALVLHLDRGWTVDGAVYLVTLPKHAQSRWRELIARPPAP